MLPILLGYVKRLVFTGSSEPPAGKRQVSQFVTKCDTL
jgi:hypothetical protein